MINLSESFRCPGGSKTVGGREFESALFSGRFHEKSAGDDIIVIFTEVN